MPRDVQDCIRALAGREGISDPEAFCAWQRSMKTGFFGASEPSDDDLREVVRQYKEQVPQLGTVNNVEIFASGTHRGLTYTDDDLRNMVRQFYRFRDIVKPTLVIGHEEEGEQPLLQNTGIPRIGGVKNLRLGKGEKGGTVLLADFAEVHPSIAKLINARAYNAVSSEVYDEPPDGCVGGKGRMLRRVALLGGELPQIKTLAELPFARFAADLTPRQDITHTTRRRWARLSASRTRRTSEGSWNVFYEVRPMKRKAVKPAQFSEKCRCTWKKFQDEPPADMPPDAPPPAGVSREDMVALLGEAGLDVSVLTDVVPDNVLAEFVRVLQMQQSQAPPAQPDAAMNDQPVIPAIDPDKDKEKAMADAPGSAGRQPAQVTLKYSEVNGVRVPTNLDEYIASQVQTALAGVKGEVDATKSQVEKFHETEKRNRIDSELADLVKIGKVIPAEIDDGPKGEPGLRTLLYRMDAVKKFADGLTTLDHWFAQRRRGPALVSFAERVKTGERGPTGGTTEQGERAKVQRFSEDPKIVHALKAAGKKPADNVAAFDAANAKRKSLGQPPLTAAEYGVSPQYA